MNKLATLVLLVGSAAAAISANDLGCYDNVEDADQKTWFDQSIAKNLVIKSSVHASVFTVQDDEATDLKIESQFFSAPGMAPDITYEADSMTMNVDETIATMEPTTVAPTAQPTEQPEEKDDTIEDTSGSNIVRSGAIAWAAAGVVAIFSMPSAFSKTSLTLLLVIGLAMTATTVESADGTVDCASYKTESRVVIVITFPTGDHPRAQDKITTDFSGLKAGSHVSEDSSLCACEEDEQCVFALDGKVSCAPGKGKKVENTVGFKWLDRECNDLCNGQKCSTDSNFDSNTCTGSCVGKAPTNVPGIVIFSHGWQKNGGLKKSRPCWGKGDDWDKIRDAENKDLVASSTSVQYWIDAGWKVGQVHWERHADEGEVKDAEAKIWSNAGRRKMRYKTDSGSYAESGGEAVPEEVWPKIREAIKDAAEANVRIIFAGHSLGNQVISRIATMYYNDVQSGIISRNNDKFDLWLLDAFYSKGTKSYLGRVSTGNEVLGLVKYMQGGGHRVHRTQTSAITGGISGDAMNAMKDIVMFSEHKPNYDGWGFFQQGGKHNAAYILFFRSINGWSANDGGLPGPLSTQDLSGCRWVQQKGDKTIRTEDDGFTKSSC